MIFKTLTTDIELAVLKGFSRASTTFSIKTLSSWSLGRSSSSRMREQDSKGREEPQKEREAIAIYQLQLPNQ